MRSLLVAPLLLLAGGCIVIDETECRHREERQAIVPAPAGLAEVRVRALAGSLAIHGRAEATAVRVDGVACARHLRDLAGIQIATRVEGDRVVIEAVIPSPARRRGSRLDLTIELPNGVRVAVEDESGDLVIDGVAAAQVVDGSGDVRVDRVAGEVSIDDDSGDVLIDGAGAVRIVDDSGDVTIRNAAAVTVVDDGSGDLELAAIAGDVAILDDGSGDIEVSDVGGGLRVEHDGPGDLDYSRVRGAVDVPPSRHDRHDRSLPAEAPDG